MIKSWGPSLLPRLTISRVLRDHFMRLSVTAFIARIGNSPSFTVALDVAFRRLRALVTFVMLMKDGFSGAYS